MLELTPAVFYNWINILGGLALLMYGISLMSSRLLATTNTFGERLIAKATNNPLKALLTGALIAMLIQSSSALIAMTIVLLNAKKLSLKQAILIAFGANIGTTSTIFLTGLQIDIYSPLIVGIGVFGYLFVKRPKQKQIAEIIIGIGLIFFGLFFMKEALSSAFSSFLFNKNMGFWLNSSTGCLLSGIVSSATIQSSSAVIALSQQMLIQNLLTIKNCAYIIAGANIGTTSTAFIVALGGGKRGKWLAISHLIYNILGFLCLLCLLQPLLLGFDYFKISDSPLTIFLIHLIFNIFPILLLYPFFKTSSCLSMHSKTKNGNNIPIGGMK